MNKKIILVMSFLLSLFTESVCFAQPHIEIYRNTEIDITKSKKYYILNPSSYNFEVDYFVAKRSEIKQLVIDELTRNEYVLTSNQNEADFVISTQVYKWGVVSYFNDGNLYKEASVDICLMIQKNNSIFCESNILAWKGTGKESNAMEISDGDVNKMGKKVISELINRLNCEHSNI